jgi:hypothetical protein
MQPAAARFIGDQSPVSMKIGTIDILLESASSM